MRGPVRFIMVGTPNSRRAGMMYFMAGWRFLAKRKTMPVWSKTRPKSSGFMSRLIPKTSKTSAEPDLEEMERLPCLAIWMPPAARTKAAVVEILKLLDWSPPVPQLSMASRTWVGISKALACMTLARPVNSSGLSPLILRPRRKAATWAWLT